MCRFISLLLVVSCINFCQAADAEFEFITLGTASGPDSNGVQAQPANALIYGQDVYLVDAGDGAVTQLAKAGIRVTRVKALFITHLHFDHSGGVLAVLGLRTQMEAPDTLTVYGPVGTAQFIDHLLAAMAPAMDAANGIPERHWQARVTVRELAQGDTVGLDGITVRVAENTHFASPRRTAEKPGYASLSYRFDAPLHAIVFTGDTGPSDAVNQLAHAADVLVSEMMDKDFALANVRRRNPDLPEPVLAGLRQHFALHHLSPEEVAVMAAQAGVGGIVVTHFQGAGDDAAQLQAYRARMQDAFKGEIRFARDLDHFVVSEQARPAIGPARTGNH